MLKIGTEVKEDKTVVLNMLREAYAILNDVSNGYEYVFGQILYSDLVVILEDLDIFIEDVGDLEDETWIGP